jgi:hypothetical protein
MRSRQTKSQILHGTSLHHPPTITLWGHVVPYRSLMVEAWDSVETFFSFEAKTINVHE